MEIDREHTISPGLGYQVCHQLGRDWCARARLAILAGVAKVRNNSGDPPRRSALERVDADQQFHKIVVGREAGRLNQKYVLTPDVLMNLDEYLFISKAADTGISQWHFKICGNRAGQWQVGIAGHDLHRHSSLKSCLENRLQIRLVMALARAGTIATLRSGQIVDRLHGHGPRRLDHLWDRLDRARRAGVDRAIEPGAGRTGFR